MKPEIHGPGIPLPPEGDAPADRAMAPPAPSEASRQAHRRACRESCESVPLTFANLRGNIRQAATASQAALRTAGLLPEEISGMDPDWAVRWMAWELLEWDRLSEESYDRLGGLSCAFEDAEDALERLAGIEPLKGGESEAAAKGLADMARAFGNGAPGLEEAAERALGKLPPEALGELSGMLSGARKRVRYIMKGISLIGENENPADYR